MVDLLSCLSCYRAPEPLHKHDNRRFMMARAAAPMIGAAGGAAYAEDIAMVQAEMAPMPMMAYVAYAQAEVLSFCLFSCSFCLLCGRGVVL